MTDLSRRVLLIGVGATGTLVATGIDSLVLGITQSEAAPATKRRITFEQARSDPKKFAADYVRQLLEEMYGKDEVKKYVHNVKFFATREDYFQEYPTLEKTDAMESNLVTNYEGSKFGKKAKSEIIVFPELFTHNRELKIGNRTISVEPTEEIIKAYLRHEFKHAQDNYHGIKLKGGNEISSTDYGRINFEVYKFIKESRGCVEEMAYIMASEKVNPMTLVLRKIDEITPGYADAIITFTHTFTIANEKIVPSKLTLKEHRLMTDQLKEINDAFPELTSIKNITSLYRKFGIK